MNKFLLAACALGAVPAFAQTPVPGVQGAPVIHSPGMMMGARVQTRAEVAARTQRGFAMLDTNRDAVIDQSELAAAGQRWRAMRAERAAGAGMAGAGKPVDRNAKFDRIDTNRDGAISRDEFTRAPQMGMHRDHMGAGRKGGMGGGAGTARLFAMADSNRDGRVTLAEATAVALQRFDRLDANRDGQLTPDERAAGRGQWRQMRRL